MYPRTNLGSRIATRLGALASLTTIFGIVFGVPIALVVFVGWPLPTAVPTLDQLRDAFQRDGVPLEVIINGLAIVVWIAWAQLAWALGAETTALVQGRVAGHARVWPGAQLMARNLVASAALVMSSLGGVRMAAAAPLTALQELEPPDDPALRSADPGFVIPPAPAPPSTTPDTSTATPPTSTVASSTVQASSPSTTVAPAPAPAPQARSETIYEVQRGDTFWGLAEKHLGSGMRWREIRDRNVGRAVAAGRTLAHGEDRLDVGWRIILPVTVTPAGVVTTPQLNVNLPQGPLTAPATEAAPGTRLSELVDLEAEMAAQDAAAAATGGDGGGGDGQVGDGRDNGNPVADDITEQMGDTTQAAADMAEQTDDAAEVTADVAEQLDDAASVTDDITEQLDDAANAANDVGADAGAGAGDAVTGAPGLDDIGDVADAADDIAEQTGNATDAADDIAEQTSNAGQSGNGDRAADDAEAGADADADAAAQAEDEPAPAEVTTTTTTAASPAMTPTTVMPAAHEQDTAAAPSPGAVITLPATGGQPTGTLTVTKGDHFWGLAERQLEQTWGRAPTAAEVAPYWRTLIDANRSRIASGDPNVIFPGQEFTAPVAPASPEGAAVDATRRAEATPPPANAPDDGVPSEPAEPEEPTATTLPPVTEPPTTQAPASTEPPTTAPPTTAAPTTAPPTTAAPTPTTAAPSPPTTAPPVTQPGGVPGVPGGTPVPTTVAPQPTILPGGGTTAPGTPSTTTPPTTEQDQDEQAGGATDNDDDSEGGVPLAAVAGTAALAGLVLVALARRRRSRSRSLRPGGYVEPRLVSDILHERTLAVAAGDVLDVVWATSRALGAVLAVKEDLPAVTAVLVAPNRGVTVHFAEPCDPAPPFEVGAATDRWQLFLDDLDEVDLVSGPEPAVAVLDTLAVVGQTDADEWLFVDLESLGAVELAGDPQVAAELAQSIVTELSLQPASDHLVDLTVIGVDELAPSVAEQGVVAVTHLDQDLVRRFEQSADETSGFLDMQGLRSTAAARAKGMARDGLFVTVVAYGGAAPADPVLLERLAAAASPGGRGVAVLAFGPLGAGATRVIVTDDGRAHIPRLGITVNAARLERGDLSRITDFLAREPEQMPREPAREWVVPGAGAGARDTVEPGPPQYEPPPQPTPIVDAGAEEEGEGPRADFGPGGVPDYLEPAWRYCVRIFADHMVETPEGELVSFRYGDNPDVPNKNTHRGPELLSYLALSGRAASATDVRDHLWWDRPVALGTVNKLLYGTRKVLGGADLLSLAQDDPVGRYRLSPEVVTDVELLSHALQHAHAIAQLYPDVAIDVLRGQLAQIETIAFRSGHLGQGLAEWAAAYRVVDRVEQPVIDAALLVAKLSTDRGPDGYEEALWAVDQGLFACPVNEALVRAAMEIEARLGSVDAVNARYLTLAAKLARDELEPEPETIDLRARLGGGKSGRSGRNGPR